MDKVEILEGNTLIAKYMGGVVIADYKGSKGGYFDTNIFDFGTLVQPDNTRYWSDINLKYHKDWNWLIPAMLKRESECERFHLTFIHENLYDIESMFKKLVISFIVD